MNTAVKHKEIIDIPEGIFSSLSMMAVARGTSLKKYIEMILIEKAEEVRDTQLYEKMLIKEPDGQKKSSEKEKADFEKWLGLKI